MQKLSDKLATIKAKRENGEGFTLVELLIVVVILVVLAAIAVPIFLNQANKARDAAAKSNVSSISSAIKNGQAVSENVTVTTATGVVAWGDADAPAGGQTITLGAATLETPAAVAGVATITPSATWCVEETSGSGLVYHQTEGDTTPQDGACA